MLAAFVALLDRQMLFVTGKGGVGKTAVASALALASATPWIVQLSSGVLIAGAVWSLSNVLRSHRMTVRAKALSMLMLVPIGFLIWHAARVGG